MNLRIPARWIIVATTLVAAALSSLGSSGNAQISQIKSSDTAAVKFFETNIRPVLAQRCFECHGPKKQRGDLRVDSLAALLEGGKSGPALKPGSLEESLLIRAIRHDDATLQMPPKQKLPPKEIADLVYWVKLGAPWPEAAATVKRPESKDLEPTLTAEQRNFWAFVPPKKAALPKVKNLSWVQTPIDAFILAKLEEKGLAPAPPADPRVLLRRLYFDLIGLPPTPAEVEEFVAAWDGAGAKRQAVVAKVVDGLLNSPHYGERWGRHWLDVARYADSNGMDENLVYGNAWRYRDYVIRAFNSDKPYDQFVREQIAGDLLAETRSPVSPRNRVSHDADRLIATGFLVIGPKMLAEDDPVKMEMDIIDEQLDTIGRTFLGLTLGCARCHDHKYDPVSMSDYYGLAGIFKSTKAMDNFKVVARWHERGIGAAEELQRAKEHADRIAALKGQIDKTEAAAAQTALTREAGRAEEYRRAARELREIQANAAALRSLLQGAKSPPTGALIVEAEDYARGNVLKSYDGYGAGIGVIYNKGELPNVAEYDVVVPTAGTYQLEVRYAAAAARPCELHVNGTLVKSDAVGEVTGTWNPDTQAWHVEGVVALKAGKNTVRLFRREPFPHFDKLGFIPSKLPPGTATPNTLEQVAAERRLIPALLDRFVKSAAVDLAKETVAAKDLAGHFDDDAKAMLTVARKELTKLQQAAPMSAEAMAVSDAKPVNLRVHLRGNHLTLGKEAPRRFPRILAGDTQPALAVDSSGRLELARWLTRPDHPLTSRVMVNRVWHWHFGAGLVRSPDNFGALGERPTHPELLDWLSVYFVDSGWSLKALHRQIVLSATYQQRSSPMGSNASHGGAAASAIDPENRLWSHWSRRRLEVEALRDALLYVGGTLDPALGGSVFEAKNRAYVPGYPNGMYDKYDLPRRSVYLPVVRSMLYDVFQAFDFADPSVANGERSNTIVAPQALFMLNGKLVESAAGGFANRLLAAKSLDETARICRAYEMVYSRPPSQAETSRAAEFLHQIERSSTDSAPGERRVRAWRSLCRVLMAANEFVFVE